VTALESELVDTAQKLTNTTEKSKKEIMECKEQVAELRLSTNSLTTRLETNSIAGSCDYSPTNLLE
jgi:phage shock protein A